MQGHFIVVYARIKIHSRPWQKILDLVSVYQDMAWINNSEADDSKDIWIERMSKIS